MTNRSAEVLIRVIAALGAVAWALAGYVPSRDGPGAGNQA